MSRCRSTPLGVICVLWGLSAPSVHATSQQPTVDVQIVVRSASGPVPRTEVVIDGKKLETDADGRLTLQRPPGPLEITVIKEGFNPMTVAATVVLGPPQVIQILLERQIAIEEQVTVSATRTDKRIEDQPMRVEVLGAEEI